MSVNATRQVQTITFTATRNGQAVSIQPILIINDGGSGFDGIVNGGTP